MDSGNIHATHKTCFKCSFEADTDEEKCPVCGRRLHGTLEMRIRGLILIACGSFLSIFLGFLTIWFLGLCVLPEKAKDLNNLGGIPVAIVLIAVCSFLSIFGLSVLATGIWQAIFGRRNLKLVLIISVLLFIFIFAGELFSVIMMGRELLAK